MKLEEQNIGYWKHWILNEDECRSFYSCWYPNIFQYYVSDKLKGK